MKRVMIAGAAMSFVMGCSSSPVTLSPDSGASLARAKQLQMARPEAPADTTAVTGLDGRAAEAAHRKYVRSFEKKAESAPETVGIITTEKSLLSTMLPAR